MSNAFKQSVLKMIDDEIEFKRSSYTAYVVDYNHKKKTIDIKLSGYNHTKSEGEDSHSEEIIEDILVLNDKQVKKDKPERGDLVYVDFVNNDMSKAVLLSVVKKPDDNIDNTGKEVIEPDDSKGFWAGVKNLFSPLID